jgi:hypothetical protein
MTRWAGNVCHFGTYLSVKDATNLAGKDQHKIYEFLQIGSLYKVKVHSLSNTHVNSYQKNGGINEVKYAKIYIKK